MKVFLSVLAEYKLIKLLAYLEVEWGKPAKEKFLKKLGHKFTQISSHPESNPKRKILTIFYGLLLPLKVHSTTGS